MCHVLSAITIGAGTDGLPWSHDGDDPVTTHSLPGQTQHQGLQLFSVELLMLGNPSNWPDKPALMQPSGRQPDAKAVMHEYLHAIGPAVGKQIGVMGMCGTKHLHHSAEPRICSRTHVQWLHGQPGAVDADHLRTEADQSANALAADIGQVTAMVRLPLRTSTRIIGSIGSTACVGGSGTGMNAGTSCSALSTEAPLGQRHECDDALSQRCNTLAFMPCALATAAIEAPGALQAASNVALVSGEYVRLVRRTAYLGVSESLSIASTTS